MTSNTSKKQLELNEITCKGLLDFGGELSSLCHLESEARHHTKQHLGRDTDTVPLGPPSSYDVLKRSVG